MIVFKDKEIRIIEKLLIANGVRSQELLIDLTDHVCCVIEDVMLEGGTFKYGLALAMSKFGGKKGVRLVERNCAYELDNINTVSSIIGWALNKFMVCLYLATTAAMMVLPVIGAITFDAWIIPVLLSPLMFACVMVWVKGINYKKFDLEWK